MLDELKEQVCEANRLLGRSGLVTLTWGNASGIDRQHGLVAIKPSGVSYEALTAEHIVVVNLEGKRVEGKLNPSSDTPTHLVLYKAFAGIGGITHTHSLHACMFAQARREIPCLGTTHADVFYGAVPVTRGLSQEEIQSNYEANTGAVIVERFRALNPADMPGALVAYHGPFTWGKSALASVENGIALEAIARMALGTLQLDPGICQISSHLMKKHYTRKHGPNAYYGQEE